MKRDLALGCGCIALAALVFSTMETSLKLPAVAGVFDPIQMTALRFLLGGACLVPVAAYTLKKRGVRLTLRDIGYFSLTGFLNIPLGMVLYQLAITYGKASTVAVIFSGNPIFVTMLAFLLLHEAIRWNNILALVLEILGILAIVDPFGSGEVSLLSVGLTVLSALLFALYAVLGKKKTAQVGSIVVTCCSFLLGTLELLILMALGYTPFASVYQAVGLDLFCRVPLFQGLSLTTLPYVLYIGVVACGLGYVFHMLAIEKTSATYGSFVFFFKPIIAPCFAYALLGETITRPMAIGIAFFLLGSLMGIIPELVRSKKGGVKQA